MNSKKLASFLVILLTLSGSLVFLCPIQARSTDKSKCANSETIPLSAIQKVRLISFPIEFGNKEGTSFLVSETPEHLYYLTAWHITRGKAKGKVGELKSELVAELDGPNPVKDPWDGTVHDDPYDLAIVRTKNESDEQHNIPAFNPNLATCQAVAKFGFPDRFFEGAVSLGKTDDNIFTSLWVVSSGWNRDGFSGSPVFDANGEILGVHVRGANFSSQAVAATTALCFLKEVIPGYRNGNQNTPFKCRPGWLTERKIKYFKQI